MNANIQMHLVALDATPNMVGNDYGDDDLFNKMFRMTEVTTRFESLSVTACKVTNEDSFNIERKLKVAVNVSKEHGNSLIILSENINLKKIVKVDRDSDTNFCFHNPFQALTATSLCNMFMY